MDTVEYQPFSTFKSTVQSEVAPEDLAENLVDYFRDQVGNALSDIQLLIPWTRAFNVNFISKSDVAEFCSASIFQGPVGKITQLFAYKPFVDCKKLYYKRETAAALDCWMERQRCLCPATTPPSKSIYDSPYCNYVLAGETACSAPYLTGDEDTCRFEGLDDDDRIFAVGPDYRVFAAPRFPCNYNLCLQWQGIRRKWQDNDPVAVDQLLREAVVNYCEHKMFTKENKGQVSDYWKQYTLNLRMLKYRYHDEQDPDLKRDCTAALEQALPAFMPAYLTPVYGP